MAHTDRGIPTGISDLNTQSDVLQQVRVFVNLIDRLENDLDSMNSVMFANLRSKKKMENSLITHLLETGGLACLTLIDTM